MLYKSIGKNRTIRESIPSKPLRFWNMWHWNEVEMHLLALSLAKKTSHCLLAQCQQSSSRLLSAFALSLVWKKLCDIIQSDDSKDDSCWRALCCFCSQFQMFLPSAIIGTAKKSHTGSWLLLCFCSCHVPAGFARSLVHHCRFSVMRLDCTYALCRIYPSSLLPLRLYRLRVTCLRARPAHTHSC